MLVVSIVAWKPQGRYALVAVEPFADINLEVPRTYFRACVLVLLAEQAGYGYELFAHLEALGAAPKSLHRGATYRALREMEHDGLVRSHWDDSDVGPARHVYLVTTQGWDWLHQVVPAVEATRRGFTRFLRLYRDITRDS